jgi:hypothetical protein
MKTLFSASTFVTGDGSSSIDGMIFGAALGMGSDKHYPGDLAATDR